MGESVSVGPMCQTSLSTGLSEWELGPHHAEQSPIKDIVSHYITSHINAISTNVPEFLPHVPFHFPAALLCQGHILMLRFAA